MVFTVLLMLMCVEADNDVDCVVVDVDDVEADNDVYCVVDVDSVEADNGVYCVVDVDVC